MLKVTLKFPKNNNISGTKLIQHRLFIHSSIFWLIVKSMDFLIIVFDDTNIFDFKDVREDINIHDIGSLKIPLNDVWKAMYFFSILSFIFVFFL